MIDYINLLFAFAYFTKVGERRVDWLGLLLDLEREQRSLKGWNCPFLTTLTCIFGEHRKEVNDASVV